MRQGRIHFGPTARDLLEARHIPVNLVVGAWADFTGLRQQLVTPAGARSVLMAVPFDGGGDDLRSAARRALAVTYATLSPNSIVVGIDRERGRILYHQIEPGPVGPILRNLGGRP